MVHDEPYHNGYDEVHDELHEVYHEVHEVYHEVHHKHYHERFIMKIPKSNRDGRKKLLCDIKW